MKSALEAKLSYRANAVRGATPIELVVILFDAAATVRDGKAYHNTYTWYFQMRDAQVVKAIAFFDTRDFDEFWNRVSPEP